MAWPVKWRIVELRVELYSVCMPVLQEYNVALCACVYAVWVTVGAVCYSVE